MSKYRVNLSTLALAGLGLVAFSSASAYESSLGNTTQGAKVNGLFQLDTTVYSNTKGGQTGTDLVNSNFRSGSEVRRVKLGVSGMAGKNWAYNLGVTKNAADNNISLEQASMTYMGWNNLSLSVGWMHPAFGGENTASPAHSNYLEGSLAGQTYATSARRGLKLAGNTDMFTYAVSGFVLDRKSGDVVDKTGAAYNWSEASKYDLGASARITISPKHEAGNAYHVGASAYYENFSKEYVGYKSTTGLQIGPNNFGLGGLKTLGYQYPDAERQNFAPTTYWIGSLEGAMVKNSFSGRVEAFRSSLKNETPTSDGGSVSTAKGEDTWYGFTGELAFVVTGESRDYDFASGTIGGLTPSSDMGAFELGARFGYLNATGANLKNKSGFVATTHFTHDSATENPDSYNNMWNVTVAGTWYANEYASVKANVVYHRLSDGMSIGLYEDNKKDHNVVGLGLRAQIAW